MGKRTACRALAVQITVIGNEMFFKHQDLQIFGPILNEDA